MEHQIEAKVIDSQHLMLVEPLSIPPGSTVLVTIELSSSIAEDQEWYAFSLGNLAAGYGDDEPVYNLSQVITPNPEYIP
jgi:hypothetical protein